MYASIVRKRRRIVSMEVVRRVVKEMEDRVECLGMIMNKRGGGCLLTPR